MVSAEQQSQQTNHQPTLARLDRDATLPVSPLRFALEALTGANRAYKLWQAVGEMQTLAPRIAEISRGCNSLVERLAQEPDPYGCNSKVSEGLATLHESFVAWGDNLSEGITRFLGTLTDSATTQKISRAYLGIGEQRETGAGTVQGLTQWEQHEASFATRLAIGGMWTPSSRKTFDKLTEAAQFFKHYALLISGFTSAILDKSKDNPSNGQDSLSGEQKSLINETLPTLIAELNEQMKPLCIDDGGWYTNSGSVALMNAVGRLGHLLLNISRYAPQGSVASQPVDQGPSEGSPAAQPKSPSEYEQPRYWGGAEL